MRTEARAICATTGWKEIQRVRLWMTLREPWLDRTSGISQGLGCTVLLWRRDLISLVGSSTAGGQGDDVEGDREPYPPAACSSTFQLGREANHVTLSQFAAVLAQPPYIIAISIHILQPLVHLDPANTADYIRTSVHPPFRAFRSDNWIALIYMHDFHQALKHAS